jgi:hypothetical protein
VPPNSVQVQILTLKLCNEYTYIFTVLLQVFTNGFMSIKMKQSHPKTCPT